MDEKFLEFWGNLLINAAHSKKQMENFAQWIRTGFPGVSSTPTPKQASGYSELFETFQKLYGLDQFSERSEEYQKMSEQALKDFRNSFKDYLVLMGIVSREDHLALVEKYEKLKARCADQEETIRHLKMLLTAKQSGGADFADPFSDMVRSQSDLFQNMIKDFGQYFGQSEPGSEKQTDERGEREHDQDDGSETGGETDE